MSALETSDNIFGNTESVDEFQQENFAVNDGGPSNMAEELFVKSGHLTQEACGCDENKNDKPIALDDIEDQVQAQRNDTARTIKSEVEKERLLDTKALEDAMQILYEDSTHTQLGASIMIMNLKATHPFLMDSYLNDIIAMVCTLLRADNCLPKNMYQTKKLIARLGLDFKNIHGCLGGCVLFDQTERKDLDACPKCGLPRYKDMQCKVHPHKVLQHFPIIPRLQRFLEYQFYHSYCVGTPRT